MNDYVTNYLGMSDVTPPKVTVRFRPVGNTKRLRTPAFNVSCENKFGTLVNYLRRQIGVAAEQPLFCYINSSFAPSLDAEIAVLHESYAIDGVLNISYCNVVAFG